MHTHSNPSALRQRRYLVLSLFDVTLNALLSLGIFALGCACLAIILAQNAPQFLAQVGFFASHILS